MNRKYVYRVAHKSTPVDWVQFNFAKNAADYCGSTLKALYNAVKTGYCLNGYFVEKVPIDPYEEDYYVKPIIVLRPDGTSETFTDIDVCSKAMGLSPEIIKEKIKDGQPDMKGNCYDFDIDD